MLTGMAHSAICVPDVQAAVDWYRDILGLDRPLSAVPHGR